MARKYPSNPPTTAVALATVAASVLVGACWPAGPRARWSRAPHMIAGMLVGGLLAALLDAWFGNAHTRLQSIGALPVGLPPLSLPDLSAATLERLVPIAVAVALLALTEAVSIARAIGAKTGQRINGSQEFIGLGLSNIAGAFTSGHASSGSFNRSGLTHAAGARTPLASVFASCALLAIVLFLAPLARWLPTPAMAGILFVVAWGLIDFGAMAKIVRTSREERTVLLVTLLATLTLQLEHAIYLGVLLSLLVYLHRTARPGIDDVKPYPGQHPPAFSNATGLPDCPQMKIVRINESLFFGAANYFTMGDDVNEATFARLDRSICATCTARVFAPCHRLPPPKPAG